VQAAFESGAPGYSNVYRFLHRSGYYVYVADRSRIIRDQAGRPVRVLGGVSDISERRRLESERAALFEREHEARTLAEAAAGARDEVLGIVSHDLGNPLSTIQICAKALLDPDPPALTGMREMARIIERSATHMQLILEDLLDRARLGAGRFTLDREPVAVVDIVSPIGAIFVPIASGRALDFVVESAPGLPRIEVDPRRIQQALSNLLGNAMKFTPVGGHVVLSARLEPETSRTGPAVRFAVSDTGPGIAPEDLPRVFDWFWQSPRGKRSGAGLGLAIAKGLVEAHGGRLAVESVVGGGTTFWFSIAALDPGQDPGAPE
jgi:signal transduction histidine kinase